MDRRTTDWVPDACTLPTGERPLRIAELDELFASALLRMSRPRPTRLRLVLDQGAEATARDLAAKETACCSFFTFEFQTAKDEFVVELSVPGERIDVLDALAARTAALL